MRTDTIGDIRLFNGDCLEVMRGIPDGSIDAIVTDPPYGISFLSSRTDNHKEIANDGHEAFLAALPIWLAEFKRIITPTGVCCCCGGGR